jgi:uncharacterized protein (TIGR03435 family)
MRRARRSAIPAGAAANGIPVLETPTAGPAVFGILRPSILVPSLILGSLPADQLNTIVVHELVHIRRRDNLTIAIHMVAESIFWFHPLLRWIRVRLLEERERACDEAVLAAGNDARIYAEAILSVCRSYVKGPAITFAGVAGSGLKQRIETIVRRQPPPQLSWQLKFSLCLPALLALSLPMLYGGLGGRAREGWLFQDALKFEVASIKPAPAGGPALPVRCHGNDSKLLPGNVGVNVPLGRCLGQRNRLDQMMVAAYNIESVQFIRVADRGPQWAKSNATMFALEAKAEDPATATDRQLRLMLQTLLAESFKLKVHRETVERDGFAITVAKEGPKMKKSTQDGFERWSRVGPGMDHMDMTAERMTMTRLAFILSTGVGRGPFIDETGLEGTFDFTLKSDENTGPSLVTAIQEQLGLKIAPKKVPVEFIVIDAAEKPPNP